MWIYQNKEFTEENVDKYKAYVYCITNMLDGRQYIGKKKFLFRKRKQKNKKTIRFLAPSDWQDYYGSSEELKKDVADLGKENFKREILHLCNTPAESSYLELYEQMSRNVLLFPDKYYNGFVGGKIHRTHVKNLYGRTF